MKISSSKISSPPETMAGSVEVANSKDQVETQSHELDKAKASNKTGVNSKTFTILRNMANLRERVSMINKKKNNLCPEERKERECSAEMTGHTQMKAITSINKRSRLNGIKLSKRHLYR